MRESAQDGFRSFPAEESGARGRVRAESFADHYSQPRMFYRSQTPPEQAHIASAFAFELSKVAAVHVRKAVVGHLRHVDESLAQRVADALALDELPPAPRAAAPVLELPLSPPLQIIGKWKETLQGRTVGILVNDGSDGRAVEAVRKAASNAGARVMVVAPKVGGVSLSNGKPLAADGQLAGTPSVVFDAVAVILSDEGAKHLAKDAAAIDFVRDAFGHLKAIGIDAGGRALLRAAGVKPDAGVVDVADGKAFLAAAKKRQWKREPGVRHLA